MRITKNIHIFILFEITIMILFLTGIALSYLLSYKITASRIITFFAMNFAMLLILFILYLIFKKYFHSYYIFGESGIEVIKKRKLCNIIQYSNVRYGLYYSPRYFFIGCVGGQLDIYYKDDNNIELQVLEVPISKKQCKQLSKKLTIFPR